MTLSLIYILISIYIYIYIRLFFRIPIGFFRNNHRLFFCITIGCFFCIVVGRSAAFTTIYFSLVVGVNLRFNKCKYYFFNSGKIIWYCPVKCIIIDYAHYFSVLLICKLCTRFVKTSVKNKTICHIFLFPFPLFF